VKGFRKTMSDDEDAEKAAGEAQPGSSADDTGEEK